ncbi:ABC-three component system middle component 6 [Draconibacterium mangrovi]|uniref:ABC-three component system middle component 6 n=1 Tax=Draconibacterium mangrovi TaxID=2697469 RepID=UPI0037448D05
MILPSKHISLSESLLGLGGILLGYLKIPQSVDELWHKYSKINNSKRYPAYHDFDNLILALNYLYLIGAIDIDEKGKLMLCD